MRTPREWILLGRPAGEWAYLAVMIVIGTNAVRNATTDDFHGVGQALVQGSNMVMGIAAIGIVAATLAGRRIGIRLVWLFVLTLTVGAPMATWFYGDPTISEAIAALITVTPISVGVAWYGSRRLHAAITMRLWPAMVAEHAAAADEFVAAIRGMRMDEWTTRPTPEAWSPAEITDHLARTYSQYAGESRGKDALRIRLGPVRRTLANLFMKPRLLAGGAFPKAKAPSTLRPSGGPPTPADGVALFQATGDSCLRDLEMAVQRRPYRRLVHPYFGALPMHEAVRFASHHIRHHCRQLPTAPSHAE